MSTKIDLYKVYKVYKECPKCNAMPIKMYFETIKTVSKYEYVVHYNQIKNYICECCDHRWTESN